MVNPALQRNILLEKEVLCQEMVFHCRLWFPKSTPWYSISGYKTSQLSNLTMVPCELVVGCLVAGGGVEDSSLDVEWTWIWRSWFSDLVMLSWRSILVVFFAVRHSVSPIRNAIFVVKIGYPKMGWFTAQNGPLRGETRCCGGGPASSIDLWTGEITRAGFFPWGVPRWIVYSGES